MSTARQDVPIHRAWSDHEYRVLLNAIERGGTPGITIELALAQLTRSRRSIENKLRKIGFLRASGRGFRGKKRGVLS